MQDDILLYVFQFLSPRDLCSLAAVCRTLRYVANANCLWTSILARNMQDWDALTNQTLPGHHDLFCDAKKACVLLS